MSELLVTYFHVDDNPKDMKPTIRQMGLVRFETMYMSSYFVMKSVKMLEDCGESLIKMVERMKRWIRIWGYLLQEGQIGLDECFNVKGDVR